MWSGCSRSSHPARMPWIGCGCHWRRSNDRRKTHAQRSCATGDEQPAVEPWPDTQTLVSIDTWTLPTPQTLVSIDTSQTRSDTAPTRSDTPNWRFRQLRRVCRVYRVSIVSNSDTLTLLTRPTRLATHVSPHKSPRMPTVMLGMQPMGSLGGSYPWPWPFGTTVSVDLQEPAYKDPRLALWSEIKIA